MEDWFEQKEITYACTCKAHSKVYEEHNEKFEYQFNFSYLNTDKDNVDILILTEFREPYDKFEFLKRFCNQYIKNNTYAIIPALGCTPFKFDAEDTVVTYKHCKNNYIRNNIKKYNPKVIITIGRAIYTITESKDLKPEHFFVNVNDSLLEFQKDDTWLYSPEFSCKVFPIPALYQWTNNAGSVKDVYEFKFSIAQFNRAVESLSIPKRRIKTLEYEVCLSPNELIKSFIANDKPIAIDTESAGLNYFKDELYSIQFAENSYKGYFCLWKDVDKNLLIELFNTKKVIVMQNAIHDLCFLIANGVSNSRCDFDTMLASHTLNENSPQGLKPNTWLHTYYGGYEEEMKSYMKENGITDFTKVPIAVLSKYASYDPIVTFQLYEYFKDRLEKEDKDLRDNFYNYVMTTVPMVVDMQMEGVPVDMKYLYEYNEILKQKLSDLKKQVFDIAGREFNIRSPKDLSSVLRNLPNFKCLTDSEGNDLITKNGDLILNKSTYSRYEDNGLKIVPMIKEVAHISKEVSQLGIENSYNCDELGIFDDEDSEDEDEGYMQSICNYKLHGAYKLHGTGAGRMASGSDKEQKDSVKISKKGTFGVNLQNIPNKDDFRRMFLVPEGYILGNADYDAMEVTLFSQASGKGALEDLILSGKEMHSYTMTAIMNTLGNEGMLYLYKSRDKLPLKKDEDIREFLSQYDFKNIEYDFVFRKGKIEDDLFFKEMREIGKVCNFQVLYGSSGFGLSKQLKVEKEIGEEILKAFLTKYSDAEKFMKRQTDFAKQNGYVKTLLGRKRRLPQLTYIGQDSYKNYYSSFKVSNLLNNSFNAPIQGLSGQVTLIAMTNIWRELKEKNMKTKLLINVHDEKVSKIFIPEKDEVKEIVERWMTYPYYENFDGNSLRLNAELEIGELWKKCKSFSYWEKNKDKYDEMINSINKRNKENLQFIQDNKI